MVIKSAKQLFTLLDTFDPTSAEQKEALEQVVKKYPHFHIVQPYYLKAIQQQQHEFFDTTLSRTAIATHDRSLLYTFLENEITKGGNTPKQKSQLKTDPNPIELRQEEVDELPTPPLQIPTAPPAQMRFSEWAHYLKSKNELPQTNTLKEKFDLIDAFLAKENPRFTPNKEEENTIDLSEKSWTSTDELMTETLAKVFVKQKKYDKALQAYQILRLKYPEKNSFFADQIKEIKRLDKKQD